MRKTSRLPLSGHKIISLPEMKDFMIYKQNNEDSCGLCTGKMVINAILKKSGIKKSINENDIIKEMILPRVELFKEYIGITPGELQTALQETLSEHKLPYTALEKQLISYPEIKDFLTQGSYLIFSYMGNAIDNPYKMKKGKKDMLLKDIHHPHYVVLLGIDEKRKIATIANPFGYKEEIDLQEFRERISLDPKYLHSSVLYLPLVESGLYMPRSCVIVVPNR
ncbi:MAG: hypothetical protein WC875_04135 [Candidatus Absconditabacterales bacterium]